MMAAHNIHVLEEGNTSSHTETTNSTTIRFTRNSQKKIHPCESRCLLLKFSHEIIAPVVFTGNCIFPDGTKLELVDAATRQQVRHEPLASAQVEIFLLNGDESWPIEELNSHIMLPKRSGKSRRDQNPCLSLEEGVVSVDGIKFKHTPKHMKKLEMVKLAARIVDQSEEVIVNEAVTGHFTVKDRRLLRSEKRYPPLPTDDVWRLEQIYRKGAFHDRLTKNGIKTVEDFLIELQNNPQSLRQILGKSMSENYWKKAITHAKTCNLGGRKYVYYHPETEQKIAVVFNAAGQVMSLDSGSGLDYFDMLSETQKVYARKLVKTAFANWENVQKFDNEISITDHLSPSPKLGDMSRCHLGNLVTVNEHHSLEFRNASKSHLIQGTAESNQRVDIAECSTSYEYADQHAESDAMSLAITSPGHSGLGTWGCLGSPSDITSVNWEELMQHLNSDAIQFVDFPSREPGQVINSAAETSATQFHVLQHGETMDLSSQNQFTHLVDSENVQSIIIEDGTSANQMNNVLMVPVTSTCNRKSKKNWTMISSILKWLLLKRFLELKKVRMSKKRKLIDKPEGKHAPLALVEIDQQSSEFYTV
ncbi:calmodulin-binding protein 60 A [Capsicum chacoense]